MNRKSFIKQLTLAGGALMLPPLLHAFEGAKRTKTLIIGAGLSGLAAAYALKKKGQEVIILESRKRIGGRVFSHTIQDRLTIELGGEWIGNSHSRIQELCKELNLTLLNNQMDTALLYHSEYFPANQWNFSDGWQKKYAQILTNYRDMSEAQKKELDQFDWWRYLIDQGCKGRDLDIKELLDSTDFGESIRQVSAFAALAEYAESSPKNEMDLKINGGNGELVKALAQKIGLEHILTDHQVVSIDQGAQFNTIRCSNGKTFTSSHIICTVPTFALSRIQWTPKLPKVYEDALAQLQYARIQKHALHFSERFWGVENFDLITDQAPQYFYHATKNQNGADGVLIAYSIGDKAAMNASQSNKFMADTVFRSLAPHFGNVRSLLQSQVSYYWGSDLYSQGAYALYGPGQWFHIRPILSTPFLNTHFAGEHLADWQGFMEGAINTGEAAAAAIQP